MDFKINHMEVADMATASGPSLPPLGAGRMGVETEASTDVTQSAGGTGDGTGRGAASPRLEGRRKSVVLDRAEIVRAEPMVAGKTAPLLVRPALEDVDLAGWAATRYGWIEQRLFEHGALLFRGFRVAGASEFERFASAICGDLYGEYGDLPPEPGGKVYRSTPYPADRTILFHNEASHTPRWPMKQFFHCLLPSLEGGETPIFDCREACSAIGSDLVEQFARLGLLYIRNFTEGLDVRWQDFFRTDRRDAVEAICQKAGIELEWLAGDGLRTRQKAPAVLRHPRTRERVFFNQIQLHHASCLDPAARQSLEELFGPEGLPRNVYFGDGSPISDDVVRHLGGVFDRIAVAFKWEAGDVLMIDNMLVAHSRNPFVGPRKILVAMGEMIEARSLAAE